MADVTALKQTLQQELQPLLQEKAATTKEYDDASAKLAPIEDKLNKTKGISRLKKPFVRATKVAPLHRKQKKLEKRIAEQDLKIAKSLNSVFASLGEIMIQDPQLEKDFNYLRSTFDTVESTKRTVLRAAKKCQHAATTEMFGGGGGNSGQFNEKSIIEDVVIGALVQLNAKRAAKSVRGAQAELKSLQEKLKDAPQIGNYLADNISRQSNFAFAMDAFGGFMSVWGDLSVAQDLRNAKNNLRDAATHLDRIADSLVNDELSLLMTIAAQARETNPYLGQILSSLETYLPPNVTQAKQKPKPDDFKPR